METKDEESLKLSYDDSEPFCKWRRQEGRDILEVHLKDFKKQQLTVRILLPDVLTITGERFLDDTLRICFRKQIKLPKNCITNEVRTKFSGGILHVVVPKKTYLFGIECFCSRLGIKAKLALQVSGVLAVVVAFGAYAYKYCH